MYLLINARSVHLFNQRQHVLPFQPMTRKWKQGMEVARVTDHTSPCYFRAKRRENERNHSSNDQPLRRRFFDAIGFLFGWKQAPVPICVFFHEIPLDFTFPHAISATPPPRTTPLTLFAWICKLLEFSNLFPSPSPLLVLAQLFAFTTYSSILINMLFALFVN